MGKIKLRPYQRQILDELNNLASVGLFMDTGTGKTITAIQRAIENRTENLLVICPKSVITQWEHVLTSSFSGFQPLKFKKTWSADRKNEEILSNTNYNTLVINFDIVSKLTSLLDILDHSWTIIVDESHRIKAKGTRRAPVQVTNSVLELGKLTPWKTILTATPTQGNYGGYIDYYTQLLFLGYIEITLTDFKRKYCVETDKFIHGRPYPVKVISGYKNTDELDNILKNCCRRYSASFGDFEPQHNKVTLNRCSNYAKTNREKVYKEIALSNSSRKRVGLKTLTSGTIMGMDLKDERYTYDDNAIRLNWLKEFLEDTEDVVVVYYQYNVELKNLIKLMRDVHKKFIVINGETKDAYNLIKNENYDVVLGQFQSASESLDGLQHKSHIEVFFAMPESSVTYKQAIGRINRDGQTKVPMYYYLIMDNTIDSAIYTMIENKIEYNEEVLEKLLIGG